jgi:glycerol uptake facilitator protein
MGLRDQPLLPRCFAEALGTYLLVFFGCGSVHAAVLTGAQSGLWQVAIVWGVAIMVAVYTVGAISGAHINPAVSVALAAWGRFPGRDVAPYALSQLGGAFLAAATLFLFFGGFLAEKEQEKKVVRGQRGSEVTAMCYGEYFPSPGPLAGGSEPYSAEAHERLEQRVSEPLAVFVEVVGTAILALAVFALTDERNAGGPASKFAPVFIGLTVAILISVIAPLTQACFNPARDFGPRLFACLAGWGPVALPGRGTGFLTVYILAPIAGAVLGGGLYTRVIATSLRAPTPEKAA